MTIRCGICKTQFVSLLVGAEQATKEVTLDFVKHMHKEHPEGTAEMQKDIATLMQLVTWWKSLEAVEVEDTRENKFLVDKMEEVRRQIGEELRWGMEEVRKAIEPFVGEDAPSMFQDTPSYRRLKEVYERLPKPRENGKPEPPIAA